MILSIFLSSAGPNPMHVIVPSGICVLPASFISESGIFCCFALMKSSVRVSRLSVLRIIFFWPDSSHAFLFK